MKYLFLVLLFLFSLYWHWTLNFFSNDWRFIQPLLLSALLLYFNADNKLWAYSYALIVGFFLDSIGLAFGVHAFILVSIIFILTILQQTVFSSRNMGSVVLLSICALVYYHLAHYALHWLFRLNYYDFSNWPWKLWFMGMAINLLFLLLGHLLYYNFWTKKHESG